LAVRNSATTACELCRYVCSIQKSLQTIYKRIIDDSAKISFALDEGASLGFTTGHAWWRAREVNYKDFLIDMKLSIVEGIPSFPFEVLH
jgi:hypothetical protein